MKIIRRRRRREHKTNYNKRLTLLEGRKPRIVIRKSNRYILLQYVESRVAQDKILHTTSSRELLEHGWPKEKEGSLKSLPACYLAGILFGKKILKEKSEAIVDLGLARSTKGSRIYAAIKGIVDSGAKVAHNTKMFPEEKRIHNDEVKGFFESLKNKLLKETK